MLRKLNLLLLFLCLSQIVFAQAENALPEKPNPPRLVNDYVSLLSPQELTQLERKLVAFDDSTGTEVSIVIVSDLAGMDKAAYTIALGKKWGIGGEKNNGVLIMLQPVGDKKKKSFIAVGKGLEGVIPDITAKRIESEEMIPAFKKGQYFQGLNAATDIIMGLANKDFAAADYEKKSKSKGLSSGVVIAIMILFFIIVSFFKRGSASHSIGGSNIPFLAALMMMGSGNSGRYNDFNSGGGDFGGFGGGDFGGGGAGGEW